MKISHATKIVFFILSACLVTSANLNKIENSLLVENNNERSRHSKNHLHRKAKTAEDAKVEGAIGAANVTVSFNVTNNTFTRALYRDLNISHVVEDKNIFKQNHRGWYNNKLFDKQLEDIYNDLIFRDNKHMTVHGTRSGISLFTSQFDKCDKSGDGVLNFPEFKGCFSNDTYLNHVIPPNTVFATFSNYSNANGFYSILYNVADSYKLNYINLYDYMFIRLVVFSWKHCSVMSPFLEEVAFECAIDIVAGTKTLNRNDLRRLYALGLQLSNTQSVRNLDFIAFFMIAQSVRTYGKINAKEDGIATRSEFNLALDSNILPSRYNQEIIDQLFEVIQDYHLETNGIDIISFTFYDFFLRLFEVNNPQRKSYIDESELKEILANYLFPWKILLELKNIPTTKITKQSYHMYNTQNITNWGYEGDHFLSFFEKNSKLKKASTEGGAQLGVGLGGVYNSTYNSTFTTPALFDVLDTDADGFMNFKDFATFIQVSYLFAQWDVYAKGRLVAGDLFDKFVQYSDYPIISSHLRNNAKRFNLFPQDLYFDIFRALDVVKVSDMAETVKRRSDQTTLNEIELKKIFVQLNLQNVPDDDINPCLRTPIEGQLPQYDWECAAVKAITSTVNYLETANNFITVESANITLTHTMFVNIDPQID